MAISQEHKQHIEGVAKNTLTTFEQIESKAREELGLPPIDAADVLVDPKTFTGNRSYQGIIKANNNIREDLRRLKTEPAIARLLVEDEDGNRRVIFISRASPVSLNESHPEMASYNAPIGRLASFPVGECEIQIHGSLKPYEVLENVSLHPVKGEAFWDSKNTSIDSSQYGQVGIESLRLFLQGQQLPEGEIEDYVSALLAEDQALAGVRNGLHKSLITNMGLRDQPILDQYQDAIFRMPLSNQLFISGPPGTGTTTTLIRRLGQKLKMVFLEDDEKQSIENGYKYCSAPHDRSWLMFTPTDLLKQYVKEAFNREQIPAPDEQIKTWTDYRLNLARNVLNVLKATSSSGSFTPSEAQAVLSEKTIADPIEWFKEFDAYHTKLLRKQFLVGADFLSKEEEEAFVSVHSKIRGIVNLPDNVSITLIYREISVLEHTIAPLLVNLREEAKTGIKKTLNFLLNSNREFLSELAGFLDSLAMDDEAEDDEEMDESFDDDEQSVDEVKTPLSLAITTYNHFVRAYARVRVQKRRFGPSSKNQKILEWMGERTPSDEKLIPIGKNILLQNALRRFVNPSKRYVIDVAKHYKRYRKEQFVSSNWYSGELSNHGKISGLEVDMLLLVILRNVRSLLSQPFVSREMDSARTRYLKSISEQFRNQILVDEATDFSAIQLACMANLVNPATKSFFGCGDFNQRITAWGVRSENQMSWAIHGLETQYISVSYRQTRRLNDFAEQLIENAGRSRTKVELPNWQNNDGVAPVLLEHCAEELELCRWLSERIIEIEAQLEKLPSIAVLVEDESKVESVARELGLQLEDSSVDVLACTNGKIIGQGNQVRVFDVQHIKGLEFEAVFFAGIDKLAEGQADIFDKYLYVGATRAATYLGVTCENKLPVKIEPLRSSFTDLWGK